MPSKVRVSILTVSDRCSQALALDLSGRSLKDLINATDFAIVSRYAIVPDDAEKIKVSYLSAPPLMTSFFHIKYT